MDCLGTSPSFANIHSSFYGAGGNLISTKAGEGAAPDGQEAGVYLGPTVLDGELTEAHVLDLVAAFCRQRLPPREVAAELLDRQQALLSSKGNVVKMTVPDGVKLIVSTTVNSASYKALRSNDFKLGVRDMIEVPERIELDEKQSLTITRCSRPEPGSGNAECDKVRHGPL